MSNYQAERKAAAAFLRSAANHLEKITTDKLGPNDHQVDLFYRLWRGIDLGIPYSWLEDTLLPHQAALIAAVPNDMTFMGNNRRENAKTAIPLLLKYCQTYKITNPSHIAYIMGTVSHECAFATVEEVGTRQYFSRYEGRADLGNNKLGDGYRYCGRGYVQITGRRNYTLFTQLLGIDLVNQPELALVPDTAAAICVRGMAEGLFTSRKLSHYDRATGYDFVGARAIVNGKDRDKLIAGYAEHYLRAML